MAVPLTLLVLLLFSHHVAGQQCPSLTSIYPPSGLRNQQTFKITGDNLNNVGTVTASSGTVTTIVENSTTISFTINVSGEITISLVPTNTTNCSTLSDTIAVVGPKVSFANIAGANLEGQPGTVFFVEGCFPSTCGDNSTSYSIDVGGVDAELLDETEFGESRNLESQFYIRLGQITASIPNAKLTLVSQYGTEYSGSNLETIDYQLGGNIISVSPSMGQKGTEVNITGTNLIGLNGNLDISLDAASLGGVPAEILSVSQSLVILKAESGTAGSGAIELNSTQKTSSNNVINGPYISVSGLWEYLEDGVITQLIPPAAQEGTTMSICGSNLLGGGTGVFSISIIGVSVTTFSNGLENLADPNVPDECVRATVPAPPGPLPQEGGINITANTKALVTTADGITFKYTNISLLSPDKGQEYTTVTITGNHLLSGYDMTEVGTPNVTLGSKQATVLSYSESEVVVQALPPVMPSLEIGNPGGVQITVSKFGLDFSVKLSSAWTYLDPGNITNTEPSFGQVGTRVTLSGTNLLGYGTKLDYVSILGTDTGSTDSDPHVNATLISSNNTMVTIDMPLTVNSLFSGSVDILLVADNGAQISGTGVFLYLMKGNITLVSPNKGQRGTYVTINGTNLFGFGTNVTEVRIGDTIAEIIYEGTSNSSVQVRATTLDVTGTTPVDITLISDTNAMVTSTNQPFSYLQEGEVSNISPDIGQIGTKVNVTGFNLLGGGVNIDKIVLDGIEPSAISNYNTTNIMIVLGDHGTRDPNFYPGQIYIESDTGATVFGGTFSHKPPGNITLVAPTVGRRGTKVTLTGYNLTGYGNYIESVFIGDYEVSDGTLLETTEGDTMLIIEAPNAPSGHSGPIKLMIDTGATIVSTQVFTFVLSGSITNVTPNVGAEGRGVLIEGENLIANNLDITSLTIGGSDVARIVTQSSSQISIIAGPSPNGTLNNLLIKVTISDGSFVEGGAFTYEEYPLSIVGTDKGQFGTTVVLNVSFSVDNILFVKFDDIVADVLEVNNNNSTVTVKVPRAQLPGNYTVDITVENTDNIIARLKNGFTYMTEGFVCTVLPSEGQRGTRVRISGEDLFGGGSKITEVSFGNILATVDSYSNKEINISVSDNHADYPTAIDITIVSDTGAVVTFTDGFTFVKPGDIVSVSPSSGQYGTVVMITGMGLLENDKDLVSVTLAGIEADVVGTPNNTVILVSAGTSNFSNGVVSILLSTGAEIVSDQSNQFQYLIPGTISVVSPKNGTEGTTVTIYGQNMLGGGTLASTVTLGGINAEVVGSNDTIITVIAGAGGNVSAPTGDIVITANTGSIVTLSSTWIFTEPGSITSFSPSSGQQGVIVTIEGDRLLADEEDDIMYVKLAGIIATVIEKTSTKIIVEAGYSNTSQSGLIVVKLVSGPVITSLTNWTQYTASLDSVTPSNGTNGTRVTLSGVNIVGEPGLMHTVSTVTFGGIPCYDIQMISQDSIRVRAGFYSSSITGNDVKITSTSGAFLVLEGAWNYLSNGEILSIAPSAATPGENVTITGTNLVPLTASSVVVTVGESESFSADIVNTSMIVFRVGVYSSADVPGTNLPIHIVANDGSTVNSDSGIFSFLSTTIAESVTPYAGSSNIVLSVTYESDVFDESNEPLEVYLAGVQAGILYNTNKSVTVMSGIGPVEGNSGSVTVVNSNGTFTGLGGNAWTYLPKLSTSHVTPLSGRNGTLVTIDAASVPTMFVLQSVNFGDQEVDILSNDNGLIQLSVGQSGNSSGIENITLNFDDDISLVIKDSWSYQPSILIHQNSTLQGYYNSVLMISGAGFNGGSANIPVSSVTVAGFNTQIISQTDALIVLRITDNYDSSSESITGSIIIISDDGAQYDSIIAENITFTYVQVKIDTVSPVQGQNRTRVTVTGTGLLAGADGIASFTLAGIEAETVDVATDTVIIVSVSGHNNATGPEDIEYAVNTGALVTIINSWSYTEPGAITTITPTNGSKGILVNILGDRLLGGGAKADVVILNGVKALEVLVSNDKIVQVRAGGSEPKMAGEVTAIIADTGATLTLTSSDLSFEYIQSGSIDTVSPSVGQFGTLVTITGIDLHRGEGISSVTIAGVMATIIEYNSSVVKVIVQRPPITSSFSGYVVIESNHRTLVESVGNFTYLREGDITSVVPSQGQRGTRVTIGGNRLYGGGMTITSVVLAGITADIISLSDSEIIIEVKESANSVTQDVNGDIVLTSDTGAQVSLIDSWTYVQIGVISSVTPQSGQYGTRVNITGERLTAGGSLVQKVIIDDIESYEVISSGENEVIFRAGEPVGLSPFTGIIQLLSNDYGEIKSQVNWTYTAASEIFDVSPANGTGGMVIMITGANLLGGIELNVTKIEIVGISVNSILEQNDTYIKIEVGFNPDGQEKEGDIMIETSSGSIIYLQNGWIYLNECPIGQYGNDTDSCSVCNAECEHCYGPTEYDCFSCNNFEITTDVFTQCVTSCPSLSTIDKICVDACNTDEFKQTRLDNNTYCIDCHQQCDPNLSCYGETASQCTACFNVNLNGVCIESCPIGYFIGNGSVCVPCSEECEPEDGCRGTESHQCNKCLNVTIFKLDEQVDECIPVCPSGYYTNSTGYCQLCHSQCNGGCDGPLSSDCYQCKKAALLDLVDNTLCVEECNDNVGYNIYHMNSTGYCVRCHGYCSTTAGCTGPLESDCVACLNFTGQNSNASEFFPRLNEQCVKECPNNIEYYVDLRNGECLDCHSSCTLGCSGPNEEDCIVTGPTPTMEESSGLFSAGAGTIGLVVGLIILLFIIMLVIIVILACKLKRSDGDSDSKNYSLAGRGEHTIIPMQTFNRIDSTVVPTKPVQYIQPISNINPIFGDSSYVEARQTEANQPTVTEEEENSQITSEDYYMDMQYDYKNSLTNEKEPSSSAAPPPVPPKVGQSSGPPIPPKQPGRLSTGSYKPAPPLPQDQEITMIDEEQPFGVDELLTQDEYEDHVPPSFQLPPPVTIAAVPTSNGNNTRGNVYDFSNDQEEELYEVTDSSLLQTVRYNNIQHDLPQLPSLPQVPSIPARQTSRTSVKSGRTNNIH